jgi:hypothetical protein
MFTRDNTKMPMIRPIPSSLIRLLGALLSLCLAAIVVTSTASAQQTFGSIVGNVSDSSGAAVPEAAVAIEETSKGVVFQTKTNSSGIYAQDHLIPGSYTVTVEAPHFKKVVLEPLTVQVDNVSRLNVRLTPGTTTETEVLANATPLLQTDSADIAITFTAQDVLTLPDYQRNVLSLEFLVPGVTLPSGDSTPPSENPQGAFRARIGGRVYGATGYQLDGTDNQDVWLGNAVINPNPDSVAEAKFSLQNFNAENGYVAGGLLSFSTKSGSNKLHGSLFEYLINNSPGFRTFGSDPWTGQNPYKSNQFGGSLGGPILRDKLFFFGDVQIQRLRNDDKVLTTVPTQNVRNTCFTVSGPGNCDLSEYLINNAQVYDPQSGDYQSANPGGKNRVKFTNNQIPTARLSQQAINMLQYYPAPNTGAAGSITNNYLAPQAEAFNAQQYDGRADYYLNPTNSFFGRYSTAFFSVSAPGAFGSLAGGPTATSIGYAGNSNIHNQSLSLGYTHTFSSTAVNDLHYGFYQYHVHAIPGGYGTQPATQAGIPGLNLDTSTTSGFPGFVIGGLSSIGYDKSINSCNCTLTENEIENQLVDTFNKVYRNHTFKFGADLRRTSSLRAPSDSHRAGLLTSAAGYTALNGSSGGLGLATFLLGETTTFARYVSTVTDATAYLDRAHFFAQDSWHIAPKLTLNYGLRYELTLPEATAPGKGGLFDVNTGLVNVFGVGGNSSRGFQQTAWRNFAPRLALAYQVLPKTVVRAGYGWSYDTGDGGIIFNEANISYPVLIQQSNTPTNASQGVFNLSQGPVTITPPTANGTGEVPLPAGVAGTTRPVHESLSVTYSYNAAIEQEITKHLAVTAAYVGNSGRHVENDRNNNVNLNQSPLIPGSVASITTEPYYIKYGLSQAINDFCNCGVGQYNSFLATLDLRGYHGYTVRANYLYQRAYGDGTTSYTFLYDRAAGYGNDNSIYHQQLIVTQQLDLPVGTGKLLGSHAKPILNSFIGNWSLSGVTIRHSGVPYTVGIGSFAPILVNGVSTPYEGENTVSVTFPDRAPGSPYAGATHDRHQWYTPCPASGTVSLASNNCSGFAQPAQGNFGNFGINNLYGPAYIDQDLGLQKRLFQVADHYNFDVRAEAFNLFNHANLSNPNATITSSTAGQISSTAGTMRRLQFALRMNF